MKTKAYLTSLTWKYLKYIHYYLKLLINIAMLRLSYNTPI